MAGKRKRKVGKKGKGKLKIHPAHAMKEMRKKGGKKRVAGNAAKKCPPPR